MSGRCLACNCVLNEFEMTRKYVSGDYLGLCNECYYTISDQITVQERNDLKEYEDWNDKEFEDD